MAVDEDGYIFILCYLNDCSATTDYQLDIYKPDGTFLSRTPNVNRAKIVVGAGRSIYTLNYDSIIGLGGRTMPTLSLWLPSPPPL